MSQTSSSGVRRPAPNSGDGTSCAGSSKATGANDILCLSTVDVRIICLQLGTIPLVFIHTYEFFRGSHPGRCVVLYPMGGRWPPGWEVQELMLGFPKPNPDQCADSFATASSAVRKSQILR